MHTIFRGGVLLAGALTMGMAAGAQQHPSTNKLSIDSVDVAATFNLEHAQVAATGTPGFWLKGGSGDAAVTLFRGLGLAVNVTGEHAANIGNNVGLSQIAVMGGPRYTRSLPMLHRTQLFAEGLFGGVHAFDSVFPGSTGTKPAAPEGFRCSWAAASMSGWRTAYPSVPSRSITSTRTCPTTTPIPRMTFVSPSASATASADADSGAGPDLETQFRVLTIEFLKGPRHCLLSAATK
jgi:hypothetical protein